MTLPNFLIIGQPKAGTSSLYHYCRQHPDIFMPSLKEPRFFAFDNKNPKHLKAGRRVFPIETLEEYAKLFKQAKHETAIGEASPNYFNSPIAARCIRQSLPNVKLIASLRNPVDRLYSAYIMEVRAGRETRAFITAFREDVDAQTWSLKSNFAYENLTRYCGVFNTNKLKVILFDDLKENTTRTMKDIFHFLGVSTNFVPDVSTVYNPGGIPRNKSWHTTYQFLTRNTRVRALIKSMLPQSLVTTAKTMNRMNLQKPPHLEPGDRKEILNYYREDILKLQDLLGRDLSQWLD